MTPTKEMDRFGLSLYLWEEAPSGQHRGHQLQYAEITAVDFGAAVSVARALMRHEPHMTWHSPEDGREIDAYLYPLFEQK